MNAPDPIVPHASPRYATVDPMSLATAASQRLWRAVLVCLTLALALCAPAWAQQVLPVPTLTAHVIDQTGTLSPSDEAALDKKLSDFEAAKGAQIVVLMVPTTQPEDIASYANRVADTWKIGRKREGDGLLVVIAKNDHQMRIEVSRALEGAVPDIAAGQIIDDAMKPRFRANDFAGGINAALDQLFQRISSEGLPSPQQDRAQKNAGGIDWLDALVLVVMVALVGGAVLKAMLGRVFGSVATGAAAGGLMFVLTGLAAAAAGAGVIALIIALLSGRGGSSSGGPGGPGGWGPVILPGSGGGWGGGGFGGGGGWSSGGGGSFGGGGASGSW